MKEKIDSRDDQPAPAQVGFQHESFELNLETGETRKLRKL